MSPRVQHAFDRMAVGSAFTTILSTREYRELIDAVGSFVFQRGGIAYIKRKNLGCGRYEVWAAPRKEPAP